MRLLHTSDWHLGRSFHREDMLSAQAAFIDFLVETVQAERVAAVLVSGDIYDRALPSVDSVALCNDALVRLAATGAQVVLISGNHDSATRLGFGASLIERAGIHLRTDPRHCGTPVLLEDRRGPVAVYALPYLEPDAVRNALECDGGHAGVLSAAMQRVRNDLSRQPAGTRSAVLAHAFVAGGEASDSERDISVGGVSAVGPSLFAGVDYTALGHLHGAQVVSPNVRYSGSPLAYSFSEEHHQKGVLLVDLHAQSGAAPVVETIAAPVPRPLKRVRGQIDDLLVGREWEELSDHYLQITLTDAVRPRNAMERLRMRFPHVLVLTFEPQGDEPATRASYAVRLSGRADVDIASDFITHVRNAPDGAESLLLQEAFAAVRQSEAAR